MNWFQRFYWTKLSKPATDRPLWKFLLETKVTSILQLGMGTGEQTLRILQHAQCGTADTPVRFAGVDLFESAANPSQHLKLKDAHRLCAEAGVKAHLIPGELRGALPRVAVTILPSDLVVINQRFDESSADYEVLRAWLPRLIHPSSTVFALNGNNASFTRVAIPAASQSRQAA